MSNAKSTRFTEGSLFDKIFLYALPLMITSILQLLYNAADQLVVGRFSGDPNALGAVGSTSSLNNLIINFLMGISIGSSVVVAQYFGAKKQEELSKAVHTSIAISLVGGLFLSVIGLTLCEPLLRLIGTKPSFLQNAVLYMRIISIGIPASALFNFGATVLRSIGDSRTPLIILSTTGLINVLFNLVFVLGFGMSVAGVAISTIIAQYLSAAWVMTVLMKSKECYAFSPKKLCFDKASMKKIFAIGIPSGIQSTLFSFSNVTIQSGANTLADEVITANAISTTIEGFTYTTMHCFQQAAITFTGQNYGAKKYDRVKKSLLYTMIQVIMIGLIVGYTEILFSDQLANLFIDPNVANKEAVLNATALRIRIMLGTYFICGIMEVTSGYLRGLGYSLTTMICSLIGACLLRILWVKTIFTIPSLHTASFLYLCFPVTWTMTTIALGFFCVKYTKKLIKNQL